MGPAAQAPVATARPASASSAVHLRVGALLASNLKDQGSQHARAREQVRDANAITAADWAVEVAWLEIDCVSVAGLGKGGRGITLLTT